jgi:hypothetical protein
MRARELAFSAAGFVIVFAVLAAILIGITIWVRSTHGICDCPMVPAPTPVSSR